MGKVSPFSARDRGILRRLLERNQNKGKPRPLLEEFTSINFELANRGRACISQKMFWATKRETTKVEERASCLVGLFDVNMPVWYCEERKIRFRLQAKIMQRTNNDSILAWNFTETETPKYLLLLLEDPLWAQSFSGGTHH
jgi:hypothetical protein